MAITLPRASEASAGVTTGRRRGGRLPDAGGVPQVRAAGDPGLSVPNFAQFAGGLEDAGAAVGELSERLFAADARINKRRESLNRIRDGRTLNEFGNATFTQFSSERDFSRQEDAEEFGAALKTKAAELLEAHEGTEESKLRLQERFEPILSMYADKAAVASVKAQDALIDQEFSEITNGLAAQARLNPALAPQLIAEGMAHLEAEKDSLRPGQEITFVRVLNSRVYGAVIDQRMATGAFDEARNMLDDPIVQAALGEKIQRRIFDRLAAVQREQAKVATEPIKGIPRDVFDRLTPEQQAEVLGTAPDETTIKGIPESVFNELSAAEQKQVLGIKQEKPRQPVTLSPGQALVDPVTGEEITSVPAEEKPEKLVEIFDADSPTKSRFVPQSEAEGQPGRERSPVISITNQGESAMAKELGKRDAERVSTLEDNAQTAFRTLAEVERMSAAVESGRFTTGVFSDFRVFLARFADFVGASEETRELLGDAATSDTLDAAANRLGVEAAQKLGRITNMSLQFVRDSLPSLARTPEGNRILMEVMRRTAEREIKLASLAEDFIQRFGTLRPQDEKTYFQAVRDLEGEDPVITEELRQRIIEGSRGSTKSFKELFADDGGEAKELSTQEEVDALEPGAEFIWKPTGQKMQKD